MTKKLKQEQPAHSQLGASSCSRWWNCPGSVALLKNVPPRPDSPYAAEGTAAHKLGEIALREGKEPSHYLYDEIDGHIVDADMVGAVSIYTSYLRNIYNGLETRVSLDFIDKSMFGTVDAYAFDEETGLLSVVDYKHGAGVPVAVVDNKQLQYYALGLAYMIGIARVEEVEMVIVQPRAVSGQPPIKKWRISVQELLEFEEGLREAVKRTRSKIGKTTLKTGEWCRFCDAAPSCPKQLEEAMHNATQVFKPAITAMQDVEQQVTPLEPKLLTNEQISSVLKYAPTLQKWLKQVEAYALEQAMAQKTIPDFKLVQTQGNRRWSDETLALKRMHENEVPRRVIFEEKTRSLAQIEKELGKDKFAEMLKDLVVKPVTGHALVPVTDKREAVKLTTAQEVFSSQPQ